METPSARSWLGAGAALAALPAAGGCFCAALLLAVVADGDAGAVYEQHRWLGAVVAACAICAFAAMMGWATLRHGGVPVPVLLMALALGAVPFAVPRGFFLPVAAMALVCCAVVAAVGLGHPPESPRRVRGLSAGLAMTALVLAVAQAIAVSFHGDPTGARAEVKASHSAAPSHPSGKDPGGAVLAPNKGGPTEGTPSVPAMPGPAATTRTGPSGVALSPAGGSPAEFISTYYTALEGKRFAAAWGMLGPGVQRAFGGFGPWKAGYARTLASSPAGVKVTQTDGVATVGLTLRAGDRDACGKTVVRRFAVTWRLVRTEAGWRAASASARKLGGPEPATECP